jgi:adenylate cyclase
MGRLWARLSNQVRPYLVGGAAAAVTLGLILFGAAERWELLWFDQLFELRGMRPPTAPIVIVTIDESTFAELNRQWPFPRALHGKVIDRIAADRPLAIGIDVLFDSESRFGPEDDAALSKAIARAGNVVLGLSIVEDNQVLLEVSGGNLQGAAREIISMPLPIIREHAAAVAPFNVKPDPDSHVRRVPVRRPVPDPMKGYEWWLGFDAQLHRLVTAKGLPTRPLPASEEMLVNFRGPLAAFEGIPYYRVVANEVPEHLFRDKIVLIGSTSVVMHDVFATAFARDGNMPGVAIHANAVDNFVRGDPVREVPRTASTILAVAAALVGAALAVRLRALRALIVTVLLLAAGLALAYVAFARADVWLRGVAVTFGLVLGYGATVVENFVREQREKQRLSRFFSPDVLRAVVRDRDGRSLRPRRRLVTVLFSDIRGFTTISERLQPEQVDEMLREYLSVMTEVVFRHGGTVDKYIGDGIMALYNAPYEDPAHALNAIRTALEFQERAIPFSARWEAKLGATIRCGVGINSGEAVVGSLGSRQRNEYTAVGDTVNLAARLESVTKDYGVPIIISEFTYELVKGQFPTSELDTVTVKGKSQPVKIYGVMPSSMRRHPRAPLDAAAQLTAATDGRICRARTVDISEGGLGLVGVPDDWPVGSRIEIRLDGGEVGRRIIAEATIVSRRGEKAGVQFASLDSALAPIIAEYVARGRDRDEIDEAEAGAGRR